MEVARAHKDGCGFIQCEAMALFSPSSLLLLFFLIGAVSIRQWKRRGTGRSPAVETALRFGWRSPGRPGRPLRTTSWRSWSAASSGRSTWASRTAWSWRPPSTSPTHRSRLGTRTGGKDTAAAREEGGIIWFLRACSWPDRPRDAMFSFHHQP